MTFQILRTSTVTLVVLGAAVSLSAQRGAHQAPTCRPGGPAIGCGSPSARALVPDFGLSELPPLPDIVQPTIGHHGSTQSGAHAANPLRHQAVADHHAAPPFLQTFFLQGIAPFAPPQPKCAPPVLSHHGLGTRATVLPPAGCTNK